ncbi:uncharacterized protein LOC129895106 isoform X2 [Solanum dulcamara]|uniref:uncharacterized protein LOC129895106 isoform X2 n=1 Tax=Solanum dulcamara TaxID=45834 RepID=UPI002485A204|nr:uncharacterized protein LOC129895106 isoform X2 [Solanum dulcamara]
MFSIASDCYLASLDEQWMFRKEDQREREGENFGFFYSPSLLSLATGEYAEDLESGFNSDVSVQIQKMYEELNPFAAFSKKERDQRYKELGLRDKIILSSGCFLFVCRRPRKWFQLRCGVQIQKMYEEIHPFAAFSKKERDQRYKELGLRDKITLSSGRFLLGDKYARSFAFFCTTGLHILVFICLHVMSAWSNLRIHKLLFIILSSFFATMDQKNLLLDTRLSIFLMPNKSPLIYQSFDSFNSLQSHGNRLELCIMCIG